MAQHGNIATGLKLITPPAVTPISELEAWNHLRIDLTGSPAVPVLQRERDRIKLLLDAVVQDVDGRDGWLNRALITQTWELLLDEFPVHEIRLPFPPLQAVLSVKYDDVNGVEQTVPAADYVVDSTSYRGWIVPASTVSWPATFDTVNAVRVQFEAGYGDAASDVPHDLRAGLLLHLEILDGGADAARLQALERSRDALLSKYMVTEF